MKPKRRMQNVSFTSMDEMLAYLPEDELEITEHLRVLVRGTVPEAKERLSFNVPFYRRRTDICFIWPGSIAWGSLTQAGVRFGFSHGNLIADETGYLDQGTRKQVFVKDFRSVREIQEEVMITLLLGAVEVDEELWRRKKR